MAVTLTTFSEADVADWFATRDINKAKPYVDLVRDLEIKGNQLSAVVPGSAPQPYIVQAYLSQAQSGEMGIVSRCTCPVGRHCKHVAAVLLKAIEERNPTERTSHSMLSWVDDLRRTSLAVAKKKARPATARAYALAAQINPAPVMDEAARKVLFGQDAAVVKRP